jgi:hypothetical protein
VPVAEIALPRAATRCFPDLVSRDSNGLVLISFRLAHTRVCARPRTRSASTLISTTYGIDNPPLPYSQYTFADIGTRQRVRVCVEELLSPDLDQIKQVEQAA